MEGRSPAAWRLSPWVGDGRILPVTADVTREEDCARVVEPAFSSFGRLDILVNNAGCGMRFARDRFLTEPTRIREAPPDVFRWVIETNVVGRFLMAGAAVPRMLRAGWTPGPAV
jgi:NAD(P)-dependent dehydrogenase (short-subunit alcohol dehydrogenase family)